MRTRFMKEYLKDAIQVDGMFFKSYVWGQDCQIKQNGVSYDKSKRQVILNFELSYLEVQIKSGYYKSRLKVTIIETQNCEQIKKL